VGRTEAKSHHGRPRQTFWLCVSEQLNDDPGRLTACRPAHRRWVNERGRDGIIVASGPALSDDAQPNGTGILLIRAASRQEAVRILDSEPYHSNGLRRYRLHLWQIRSGSISPGRDLSSDSVQIV
jgi:hypothetical protein